jgi:hypothetical protein
MRSARTGCAADRFAGDDELEASISLPAVLHDHDITRCVIAKYGSAVTIRANAGSSVVA